MKRVLIISAHPDDEVLGCGGLISKYRSREVNFKVVFIGEGSTCRHANPESEDAQIAIQDRNNSALNALKFLGVEEIEFNNLPCGRLDQCSILSINKIIEKSISEFKPDTVLTHSRSDVNNDHKIVFNATIMATRPGAKNHVNSLMSYEVLSSSEWAYLDAFMPNFFEELTENEVESKWQALSLYDSEIKNYPFPRSYEGVKTQAMTRGMQSGFIFAEAFQLIRRFKN